MSDDTDDLNSMMSLDFYLSSLSDAEYNKVSHKIKSKQVFPVASWDLSGNYLQKTGPRLMRETEKLHLDKLSKKFKWKLDLDSIMPAHYDAIVVTNAKQDIYWASDGFTVMTGYPVEDALGKKPNFLQGKNTSLQVRKNIKEHLLARKPYSCTIVNYRKNEEEYLCEVKIIPITNQSNKLTHFIAFEREAV